MEKQDRFRNFACITYMSEDELKKFLRDYRRDINHYAYAKHDRDDNEPHFHVILIWYNNMTCSALRKRFSKYSNQNSLTQPLLSKTGSFEYLTHTDEESKELGKTTYDKSIIRTDNDDYWNYAIYEEDCEEDKSFLIIADLIAGVPLSIMHKRYGREFVINYAKYKAFANSVIAEIQRETPHLVDENGEIIK